MIQVPSDMQFKTVMMKKSTISGKERWGMRDMKAQTSQTNIKFHPQDPPRGGE